MEMQRWSTRWKTRRWPWDSAVTVLITFAILLRAAEVRGGKKAKGSRRVQSPISPPPSGRRTQGTAGAAFQRKPVRAAPDAGEARGHEGAWGRLGDPLAAPGSAGRGRPSQVLRRDGSRSASAFNFGCGFNAVKGMHWRGGKMKEIHVEQSDFSSSTKLSFVECEYDFQFC